MYSYNTIVQSLIFIQWKITTGSGCTVIDTLLVKVTGLYSTQSPNVFVPKAFSPNGDQHNDKLTPLLYRIKELKYFRIYNRWGQMVFETNTPIVSWDGTFKGVLQGTDIFIWIIEAIGFDGTTYQRRGSSILLK